MEYEILSNVTEKRTLFIDDDMTVGDIRTIIRLLLDVPEGLTMSMSYNGKQLTQDELSWGEVGHIFKPRLSYPYDPHNQSLAPLSRKIFCHVTAKQTQSLGPQALRVNVMESERSQREQARLMEPMIESIAQNPVFLDTIFNMNPELKKMVEEHPEIAKQMRDPEMLKMVLMSQVDPDRRREFNRNLELQLNHIEHLPGGHQLLERYMSGFLRDHDNALASTEADLHMVSEDATRPDPTKDSNSQALPNPWVSPRPNPQTNSTGSSMPFLPANLFGMNFNRNNSQGFSLNNASCANSHGVVANRTGNFSNMFAQSAPSSHVHATKNVAYNASESPIHPPPTDAERSGHNNLANNHTPQEAAVENPVNSTHDVGPGSRQGWVRNRKVMYDGQLHTLKEMGFEDEEMCLEALEATRGDVEEAVAFIQAHQP